MNCLGCRLSIGSDFWHETFLIIIFRETQGDIVAPIKGDQAKESNE